MLINVLPNYLLIMYVYIGGAVSAVFGYPTHDQAELYCKSFRTVVGGQLGLWIVMHLIVFASVYAYSGNAERESIFGNSYKITLDQEDQEDHEDHVHSPLENKLIH